MKPSRIKDIKSLQTKLLNGLNSFMKISNLYIFYILLTIFTLLYLYYSFFDQVILCDSIDDVKDSIQWDLANLKDACHDYEILSKFHNIQKLRVLDSGNSLGLTGVNWDIVSRALNRNSEALSIIRNIKRNAAIIRKIEPNFKPPLESIIKRYERSLNTRLLTQVIR